MYLAGYVRLRATISYNLTKSKKKILWYEALKTVRRRCCHGKIYRSTDGVGRRFVITGAAAAAAKYREERFRCLASRRGAVQLRYDSVRQRSFR